MSSTTVLQILQVTAAQTDAKPLPASRAQGEEFQRLLARAADSGEQRPMATAESGEASAAEQPLAANSDQDAATAKDDQSTSPTEPLAAVEGEEPIAEDVPEDRLLDEIEWSAAAVFAVSAQLPATSDYPVEVVEVTVDAELTAVGTDLPDAETLAKPQASVTEFNDSLQVQPPTEVAVSLAPDSESDAQQQSVALDKTASELPKQESAELPGVETGKLAAEGGAVQTDAPTYQATTEKGAAPPSKLPKLVQSATKQTDAAPVEEKSEEAEVAEKPIKPHAAVAAPSQPEVPAPGAAKTFTEKDSVAKPLAAELPPIHHGKSESAHNANLTEHSASSNGAAPTDASADSDPVSTVDRARFVQRVSRAFQSANGRDGLIQLRLSPPELGSLRISIATHQGVLSAKVEADTAAARNVILDNLPALRERLAEQQIRLEKFDVDVRRDGGQDPGNWQAADRESRNSDNRSSATNRLRPSAAASPQVARTLGGVTDGSLDVRI